MESRAKDVSKSLRELADPRIAEHSQRFFKTGPGEYGEGDLFLGIRVPVVRRQVAKFKDLPLEETVDLLRSSYHEERLCAVLLLVSKFKQGNEVEKKAIYDLYLTETGFINNWDLVDSSAHFIVGAYLNDRDKGPLYELAESDSLWERRIAIISTLYQIRRNRFEETLKIAAVLRDDREDLIHKAVGWMLREVGKRDPALERFFLKQHYKKMPRTMLRYAIEKFPQKERRAFLEGRF